MDFGCGLEGVGYEGNGFSEHKVFGSMVKQGRTSGYLDEEDELKNLSVGNGNKMLRRDEASLGSKGMLFQTRNTGSGNGGNGGVTRSNGDGSVVVSSSSSLGKSDGNSVMYSFENVQAAASALTSSYHSSYSRSSGVRGPFTPSQWLELEHQALLFKYITTRTPIPQTLLNPLRKNLNPSYNGFSTLRSNALGWGSFHMGFSGNTDPEPGRCRRTDGKKWRCSRDAVADQKYCERHMNRGRHRSRKPVEGQTGQATARTGAASASSKAMTVAPAPTTATSVTGSVPDSSGIISQHQAKTFQPSADPSSAPNLGRFFMDKPTREARMPNSQSNTVMSPVNIKSKDLVTLPKQQFAYQDPSHNEYGLLSSDSLLSDCFQNRMITLSSNMNSREDSQAQSLHHFIDDWPRVGDQQQDRTQLSISIPFASDFSSTSSSPVQGKATLSPLKLACDMESIQMGLGVGALNSSSAAAHRQSTWVPISWDTSLGGPLAEVLHKNTSSMSSMDHHMSSDLNLMAHDWNASSPLDSSPSGVLQKTVFGSVSNSSTGSSPRAENKGNENTSLSDDPLGSSLVNS